MCASVWFIKNVGHEKKNIAFASFKKIIWITYNSQINFSRQHMRCDFSLYNASADEGFVRNRQAPREKMKLFVRRDDSDGWFGIVALLRWTE